VISGGSVTNIHIIGGGTVAHVRPHLAIAAVAYGTTARKLYELCKGVSALAVRLHLTRMASGGEGDLETNEDVKELLDKLVEDPSTKVIFMPVALCDFEGSVLGPGGESTLSGKNQPRLRSGDGSATLVLMAAEKLIGSIRKKRKDIFLVGFKTTAGMTENDQYLAGLELLKKTSCNLVLVNDVHTRLNIIVAPELARYAVTQDRDIALRELVTMMNSRSRLTFTRTTVVDGELIPWGSEAVPQALRTVVEWCVEHGAYKPFLDVTVGHFAFREMDKILLSSRRKQNFNRPECRDLVKVFVDGESMTAHGAKPSAGTPSQYAVLSHFPEFDCIVHFHCPLRAGSKVVVRSQKEIECGSAECGENTWKGMSRFGNLAAVMLDQHGPNIIFSSKGDPEEVTKFIAENFDLSVRSDGIRSEQEEAASVKVES